MWDLNRIMPQGFRPYGTVRGGLGYWPRKGKLSQGRPDAPLASQGAA